MGVQPSGLVITGRADEVLLNASLVTPRNKARVQFLEKKFATPKAKPQPKRQPERAAEPPPCPQTWFSILAEGAAVQPSPDQEVLASPAPSPMPALAPAREADPAASLLVFLLFLRSIHQASKGSAERMEDVTFEVLARHGVSLAEIRGPRRARSLVAIRFEAQYEVRARCRVSLPEMGRYFHRDHTSILSATDTWAERNGLPKPWQEGGS